MEVAGHDDVSPVIHPDAEPRVLTCSAQTYGPRVDAGRGELRDEDVGPASAGQRATAEVDGAAEIAEVSGQSHVPVARNRYPIAHLVARTAKALGPQVSSRGGVLGDEDVGSTGTDQAASAEIHSPLELAGDENVAAAVHPNAVANVATGGSEPLGPQVSSRRRVFRYEDVFIARTGQHCTAEVHPAFQLTGDDRVAVGVDGDGVYDHGVAQG